MLVFRVIPSRRVARGPDRTTGADCRLSVKLRRSESVETPHDLFQQVVANTGDRIAAIRAIRSRFGLDRRQAQEVMLQVEGVVALPDNSWPDHEYVPYLEAEQQLYTWILSKVGGIEPAEAMRRAVARFHYEPESERGAITHDGAWRIAMADLFGDHCHDPEEFGLAKELEAQTKRFFGE